MLDTYFHPFLTAVVLTMAVTIVAMILRKVGRRQVPFRSRKEYIDFLLDINSDLDLFLERSRITPREAISRKINVDAEFHQKAIELQKKLKTLQEKLTEPGSGSFPDVGVPSTGTLGEPIVVPMPHTVIQDPLRTAIGGVGCFGQDSWVGGAGGSGGDGRMSLGNSIAGCVRQDNAGGGSCGSFPHVILGAWYRLFNGCLAELMEIKDGYGRFETRGMSFKIKIGSSEFSRAIPRPGEWWKAWVFHNDHVLSADWGKGQVRLGVDSLPNSAVYMAAICGCIKPVNYGKGDNPEVSWHPEVGRWVRGIRDRGFKFTGELAQIVELTLATYEVRSHVLKDSVALFSVNLKDFQSAFPRKGEWWVKKPCKTKHGEDDEVHPVHWSNNPVQWNYSHEDSLFRHEEEAALCGCLTPFNYGKGWESLDAAIKS